MSETLYLAWLITCGIIVVLVGQVFIYVKLYDILDLLKKLEEGEASGRGGGAEEGE